MRDVPRVGQMTNKIRYERGTRPLPGPSNALEAKPGFEPGIRALQARALPLGYFADMTRADSHRPLRSHGAGYGDRTRDLNLGKVARYQLR